MMEIKFRKKLCYNAANDSFSLYLPKEIGQPLRDKGIEDLDIWYDQKENVIKIEPIINKGVQ